MAETWQDIVEEVINNNKDRLIQISSDLWNNPEPAFQEHKAHKLLTSFLEDEGFSIERHHVVETGFRAKFECLPPGGAGESANAMALNVCFPCEYDAAVGVGHSAAHNLCSEASLAAAIAIKRCIQEKKFYGKVTVLGTPGEDSGDGAKIDMIRAGSFRDVDFALMLWPLNRNLLYPKHFTLVTVDVTYHGKAAHASAYPWEGKNALDAAVSCYTNIALLRQQLRPTWMINGIIKEGGIAANTIPAESKMQFWLRAPEQTDIVLLQQKVTACFVAAAKATGCELDYQFSDKIYTPMQHADHLGELYAKYGSAQGFTFCDDQADGVFHTGSDELSGLFSHTGSTDMGNVSHVVPSLTPAFDIGTKAFKNSVPFTEAANMPEAHENTLRAAKAMALTAADVMSDPKKMEAIKHEYTLIKSPSGHILTHTNSRARLYSHGHNVG